MTWGDVLAVTAIGFFALLITLFLFVVLVAVPRSAWVRATCLEMGYAEFRVDWKLTAYCVQRDYRGVMKAIPLEELR